MFPQLANKFPESAHNAPRLATNTIYVRPIGRLLDKVRCK